MFGALYLAQDLYVQPATDSARQVASLFNITLVIALVVFVLVEGLLIYMIVKFRKNTKVPREESHRGHTTAEVVWTIIPAAILLFLGFLSAGTLVQLDTMPDDIDFTVHVEGQQFAWQFVYPDENGTEFPGGAIRGPGGWCAAPNQARCSIGDLRIQENSRVRIITSSIDVIHAFAIPEFAIKRDAVPAKPQDAWFDTPNVEGNTPTTFFVQCMEYCGVGHHDMRATLTVFPESTQPLPYGRAPAAAPASG